MRVHIIGAPGSGKSTFARSIAGHGVSELWDLDFVVYDRESGKERSSVDVIEQVSRIIKSKSWITEGAYHEPGWLQPLLDASDVIVWLDPPWSTCAARMVKRHIQLSLQRRNPHPGILRLARFIAYTRRVRPRAIRETNELLQSYAHKVIHCSSSQDSALALERLTGLIGKAR
jgi:adenylate kinase family enzyme